MDEQWFDKVRVVSTKDEIIRICHHEPASCRLNITAFAADMPSPPDFRDRHGAKP
jgi:hypothetical protein